VPVDFEAANEYRVEVFYRNHIGDTKMNLQWYISHRDMVADVVGGKQPGFAGTNDPQFTAVRSAGLKMTRREAEITD
jgi:hypothetical protein